MDGGATATWLMARFTGPAAVTTPPCDDLSPKAEAELVRRLTRERWLARESGRPEPASMKAGQ
jgi:hypothetical protein